MYTAILKDMQTIKKALYYFLHLPNPSSFNKAQVLELEALLEAYTKELDRLTMESTNVR